MKEICYDNKVLLLYKVDEHFVMDLDFILKAVRSAVEVKYVNEVLGNFCYNEGTKTFQDLKTGQSVVRFETLLKKYRKELPLWQRWQVTLKYIFYKTKRFINIFNIISMVKRAAKQ